MATTGVNRGTGKGGGAVQTGRGDHDRSNGLEVNIGMEKREHRVHDIGFSGFSAKGM